MRRAFVHIVVLAGGLSALAGCGFADSHAPVPEFMRSKQGDPPPLETPPDVKQLVRKDLDQVFVANSAPQNVQVSRPYHEANGPGWTACVRADLTSATGKPLGSETYRITINQGVITDRRRIDADDNCIDEHYEPI